VWALLTGQDVNRTENLKAKKAKKAKKARKARKEEFEVEEDETQTFDFVGSAKAAQQAVQKAVKKIAKKSEAERLAEQRKYLFQFIFLSTSMIIFAYVMIGFLDVPAREVGNIGIFVFLTASLLKYLFDFTVTDSQVRMIILSGLALYVDSLRETAGRIASQF